MSKIGDLFVRLGLKKSEFDRGMDEAQAKTKGFGESIKGIASKAKVAFAAIAVAAAAFVNEFVAHSQRFGDQWDQTMSRMKSAWNTFLTTLTNWDWDGFGKRIGSAMDAAARSTAMHDLEAEVQNSINIRKGQMQEELAMLRLESQDTRLSYEQRAEAARKYLDMVRPIYDQEIKLRQEIRNADLDEYLAKAGINQNAANRQAVETLLTDVAPNTALLNALSEYSKKNRGAKKYKFTAEDERLVNDFLSTQDVGTGAALASLAEYYQGSRDKEAKKAADAITGLYSAQAAFNEETRRIQQTKNNAEARSLDTSPIKTSTGADAALEAQRRQAERIAQQAAEYQLSERAQLKKHYEEEKALLEQFGIDTTMLTLKWLDADAELTRKELAEDREMLQDQLEEFEDTFKVELDPFELGPGVQEFLDELTRLQEEAEDRAQRFKEAMVSGFADGIQELTDQLMGLSEVNGGAIFKALLSPLADMAQQEGELLIMQGLGIEAIKTALTSLNGIAAVAAGTALVAAAAAVKSGLSRIAQTGGSAAGVATTAASDVGTGLVGSVQDLELTVRIEGQLRGSDIVLAAERTQANWSR